MKYPLIIFFLILSLSHTDAEEMAMMGIGVRTCAKFASDVKDDPSLSELHYFLWAQGFMSGLNVADIKKQRNLSSKSVKDQMSFIDIFCDKHPLAPYMLAVI